MVFLAASLSNVSSPRRDQRTLSHGLRHCRHPLGTNSGSVFPKRNHRLPAFLSSAFLFAAAFLLQSPGKLAAHDWPQHLGPLRNSTYTGKDVAATWTEGGPKTVWKHAIGEGYSAPVVAGDTLLVFHRRDDQEEILALDAGSGEERWSFAYASNYKDRYGFNNGPRATPTVDAGRVYALGAGGILHAVDTKDGRKLWRVDVHGKFNVPQGFFGAACSPLVEKDLVLLNAGGDDGNSIVALDSATGELRWKAGDHEASYSSPVGATIAGERHVFFFTRHGLVDVDPTDGRIRDQFKWRARLHASVNAATPIVVADHVFISASYRTGGVVSRVTASGLEKVWSGDEILSNHYLTSVARDGFLYGLDGRQESTPRLRCVEFATGEVRWTADRFGSGSVTLAGSDLLFVMESGELRRVAADPAGYNLKQSAKILPGEVRAYTALAYGRLYARDGSRLVCVDLRRETSP